MDMTMAESGRPWVDCGKTGALCHASYTRVVVGLPGSVTHSLCSSIPCEHGPSTIFSLYSSFLVSLALKASGKFADELEDIRTTLSLKESEDSWDAIATALTRLKDLVKGASAESLLDLVVALRSLSQPINGAIISERSRLSGAAIDLVSLSAAELGDHFDPLLPVFIPTVLLLCTRTNKVFLNRGRACLHTIISSTQSPAVLPLLVHNVKDKSVALRQTVAEAAVTFLNSVNPLVLEKEARARDVETLIRVTATDANADIRRLGRQLFEAYKLLLPQRVARYVHINYA